MSSSPIPLESIARLPSPGDNTAIAVRQLAAGTEFDFDGTRLSLSHAVLEGHRFAVRRIARGEALLSWGLPFGHALRDIQAGEYVCNALLLEGLGGRQIGISLPAEPNFADHLVSYQLDPSHFVPAPAVEFVRPSRTFLGYQRPGGRGTGTRNAIVLLGTTSRTAGFVRQLAARLQPLARVNPGIDGIVAVAHTEGAGPGEPNNAAEVLRALAGFMVHPNVGAVLAVDAGMEPISNERLRAFMAENGYAIDAVRHRFLSTRGGLAAALAEGEAVVRQWLPAVASDKRTEAPLSGLRIALQCGGSDAFSGISGNPLAGAVVHELIRHGGTGVLTETDEVVGSEHYLLSRVRNLDTARRILEYIERFKERLAWHGTSAESNPSGGNKVRGLYNITLKSLGAVHKKDPRTRVDFAIDYAQPLGAPGFTFMNGPGNDLEGIAGQVASGCNLILFVTGNGSITNFPFVPTIKITTTTRRHRLLEHEMDFNAGRYLDGESMESLASEAFNLAIATASGARTQGERAGHSQVSLWRNWRQTGPGQAEAIRARPEPDGEPIRTKPAGQPIAAPVVNLFRLARAQPSGAGFATERVGLVLPTSMCSAQIARLAAARLNERAAGRPAGVDRYVALAHSEGCGFGSETVYTLLQRTYLGYATHPNVAAALLLEHGCEKLPNDFIRAAVRSAGLPEDRFGWASVQLDGGIEKALARVEAWFVAAAKSAPAVPRTPATIGDLAVGILSDPSAAPPAPASRIAALRFVQTVVGAGGSVLIPEGDPLLATAEFTSGLLGGAPVHATLAYGQPMKRSGFHVVGTETDHWEENATGLGACGAHVIVGFVADSPRQGHPLLSVLQVAPPGFARLSADEVDLVLTGDTDADAAAILDLLRAVAEQRTNAAATAEGFVDFQITRGLLGVSS